MNSVIDKVSINADAIVDMLAEYAGTDLLCYRSTSPQGLIDEQARMWDPLLAWSLNALNAPMNVTSGVMFVAQDPAIVDTYRTRLAQMNFYQLAGVHDLITISGSAVISMALITNHIDLDHAWTAATVDEAWQEQLWGVDEEAQEALIKKRSDFEFAYTFWKDSSDH